MDETLQAWMPDLEAFALTRPLSERARAESLVDFMSSWERGSPVWVFACGSLIWSPCFEYVDRRQARLDAFERAFCMWSVESRGDRQLPGLGLALEPGWRGCQGIVFELDPAHLEASLDALWAREMWTGVYQPRWVTCDVDGVRRRVMTFVINDAHPQYAPSLPLEVQAAFIARAKGKFGSCREYLLNTHEALGVAAIADAELDALVELVRSMPQRS